MVITAVLFAAAALVFWFFYPLRSYIVMGLYSARQSAQSVMAKSGFRIDMPSGGGWYPFVLTYNASGFRDWAGIGADMSIMYNFGAFDALTRTSSIYDANSDRYSSFYGAYAIKKDSGAFGFSEGAEPVLEEIEAAVRYDYTQLVMRGFGCDDPVFDIEYISVQKEKEFAGTAGWTRIDARIEASGAAHNFRTDRTAYIQYGPPAGKTPSDFAKTELYGRVYAAYLSDFGCTVMIYVIAPSKDAVEECAENILRKTRIVRLQ